jgi:hypothetical protein
MVSGFAVAQCGQVMTETRIMAVAISVAVGPQG